jgi:hypothetical protein
MHRLSRHCEAVLKEPTWQSSSIFLVIASAFMRVAIQKTFSIFSRLIVSLDPHAPYGAQDDDSLSLPATSSLRGGSERTDVAIQKTFSSSDVYSIPGSSRALRCSG